MSKLTSLQNSITNPGARPCRKRKASSPLSFRTMMVSLGLTVVVASALSQSIPIPQGAPYLPDANTLLLEHFDGSTGGTPSGSPKYTNGVFGQAVYLKVDSYIGWGLGALSQGTVEFWCQLDSVSNSVGICSSGLGVFFAGTYGTRVDSGGLPGTLYHNGSIWVTTTTPYSEPKIRPRRWNHYATTWGPKGIRFYVDGNLVASGPNTSGQNTGTSWWAIGGRSTDGPGWGANYFQGAIDELRISNIQREFTNALAEVQMAKAFTLDFKKMLVGSNYQIEASPDLITWTNWGPAFTATNSEYSGTTFQRTADWGRLHFRLRRQ